MKIISTEAYNTLLHSGHCVPRAPLTGKITDWEDIIVPFRVSKEYQVISPDNKTPLKVRCTQDCPIHIRLIEQEATL